MHLMKGNGLQHGAVSAHDQSPDVSFVGLRSLYSGQRNPLVRTPMPIPVSELRSRLERAELVELLYADPTRGGGCAEQRLRETTRCPLQQSAYAPDRVSSWSRPTGSMRRCRANLVELGRTHSLLAFGYP